jgi:hypothetical protein
LKKESQIDRGATSDRSIAVRKKKGNRDRSGIRSVNIMLRRENYTFAEQERKEGRKRNLDW